MKANCDGNIVCVGKVIKFLDLAGNTLTPNTKIWITLCLEMNMPLAAHRNKNGV